MTTANNGAGPAARLVATVRSIAKDPAVRRRAKQASVAVPAAIVWTMSKTRSMDSPRWLRGR